MTFVQIKPATLLVGEERFDMESFAIPMTSFLRQLHIGDEAYRILITAFFPKNCLQRAIAFLSEIDIRYCKDVFISYTKSFKIKRFTILTQNAVNCCAKNIFKTSSFNFTKPGSAVEFPVTQYNHPTTIGKQFSNRVEQLDMQGFLHVPLGLFDDLPTQRQGAFLVKQTDHQTHTAFADSAAVDGQQQGLIQSRNRVKQLPNIRQKVNRTVNRIIFDKPVIFFLCDSPLWWCRQHTLRFWANSMTYCPQSRLSKPPKCSTDAPNYRLAALGKVNLNSGVWHDNVLNCHSSKAPCW